MTRRARHPAARATDREVGVVAAVLVAGSEKAAAHRLGLSHSTVKHHLANARSKVGVTTTAQLVWILAPRLPEAMDCVRSSEHEEVPREPVPSRTSEAGRSL
jgi:DNA-binding CsgD family transcriptional regulator